VDETSVGLKRELRLRDLVLAQIILIVGSTWIGTAAKLGGAAPLCWLLASVFFFVPLVVVVVFSSRWQPLEGGLYQWARLGGGEMVGFLVGWNLWVYAIVIMSSLGLELMTMLSYAFGPRGAWLASSRSAIMLATLGMVTVLALAARVGLKLGKWVHNAGGAMRLGVYAMLIGLPLVRLAAGARVDHPAVAVTAPAWTLVNVNIVGKMGFGAFSGFEYVAIFAGEAKDPSRAVARSVVIAAPAVIAMFVLGTIAVGSFVRPDDIDLIAPLPQALAAGALPSGFTRWLAPVAALALAASTISYGSAAFSGIARLPMVAGWDGLLPAWFTRLHPTHRTPVHAITVVAVATAAFGLAGLAGVGGQEAYQLIGSAALVLYALTYLVMFALPIVGLRAAGARAPVAVQVLAASGFVTTLLFIVLAVFPIIAVDSSAAFAWKISGVVVGANAVGLALFVAERRRRAAAHREID
jgi:amino acid transporter